MTIVQVQPKSIVIDDSFAPPSAGQLTGAGVAGEVRYASDPVSNPKNWWRTQMEERWALGIATLAIHEQRADDHNGGAPAGKAKADVFARWAEAVGWPREAPAMVSCDSGPSAKMVDYADAFEQRIRQLGWSLCGAYVFGPEGVQMLVDNRVCTDILWQASAGSLVSFRSIAEQRYAGWDVTIETPPTLQRVEVKDPDTGKLIEVVRPLYVNTVQVVHNQAHAFQRIGYSALFEGPFAPGQVDENVVLRPLPMWLPGGATPVTPAPIPATQEDSVPKLVTFAFNRDDIYLAHNWDPAKSACSLVTWCDLEMFSAFHALYGDTAQLDPGADANMVCLGPASPGSNFKKVIDAATSGGPGPKGDQGPKGDTGPAGAAPVLNRAAIVAALQKD